MKTLNDLRIGIRLTLGFGAVLALLLVIVALAGMRLLGTRDALAALEQVRQRAAVAQDWQGKTQLNIARTLAIAKASGQPEIEKYFAPLMAQTSAEISALQKGIDAGVGDDEAGRALLKTIAQRREAYIALRKDMMKLVEQADQPAAEALLDSRLLPAASAYLDAMGEFRRHATAQADAQTAALHDGIGRAAAALAALLAASLAVGAAMAFFITRSVTAPLREAVETARAIAASDLTHEIASERRDEMGELLRALGTMQQALRALIGQVQHATDSIGTASAEIATGNQDLSSRTEQTASSLQQTGWSSSPARCASRPTRRGRPTSSPPPRPRSRRAAARWSRRWSRPCRTSTPPRAASPTSSA
jgi:methyl-accepting chemotaxis protein